MRSRMRLRDQMEIDEEFMMGDWVRSTMNPEHIGRIAKIKTVVHQGGAFQKIYTVEKLDGHYFLAKIGEIEKTERPVTAW